MSRPSFRDPIELTLESSLHSHVPTAGRMRSSRRARTKEISVSKDGYSKEQSICQPLPIKLYSINVTTRRTSKLHISMGRAWLLSCYGQAGENGFFWDIGRASQADNLLFFFHNNPQFRSVQSSEKYKVSQEFVCQNVTRPPHNSQLSDCRLAQ